jgi:hypothetical protein
MAVGGPAGGPCVALPVNFTEVDWSAVKRVLARIGEQSGDFLEGNILIGGGAAWFYRSLLEISRDRDFSAPDFSAEENRIWISKDIDFIGTKREEIPVSLGIPIEGEPPAPRIDGIWIDSPNEGLFLTYERALPTALTSTLPDGTDFLVASPILLHREKTELVRRKNRPQDGLHLETLARASRLVLCRLMETDPPTKASCRELFLLLKEAQEISPELLCDLCLRRRTLEAMERMRGQQVCKNVFHLLEKQILPLMSVSSDER